MGLVLFFIILYPTADEAAVKYVQQGQQQHHASSSSYICKIEIEGLAWRATSLTGENGVTKELIVLELAVRFSGFWANKHKNKQTNK